MSIKQPSVTIGIPTYYGGPALVKAVESIMASRGVDPFRLIVCVDGNPLAPEIESELVKLGAEVVFSAQRGGQVARIKQIIGLCDTDILILTQDDIRFEPDTLARILETFECHPEATMVGARVLPAPAETFLEKIIEVGVRLTHRIGDLWNHGDNYLLASGRCLALRTEMAKRLEIPDEVINSDAYLYFENKAKGGKFVTASEAKVYNRSPQKLREYVKQSKKFQFSKLNVEDYFRHDMGAEYAVPLSIEIRAGLAEFVAHPLVTPLYLILRLYAQMGRNPFLKAKRFWDTDVSTKSVQ